MEKMRFQKEVIHIIGAAILAMIIGLLTFGRRLFDSEKLRDGSIITGKLHFEKM